ncbi:MAG: alpha/beta hydrolase, partial [Rhodobacteraceae bacterium]|nr:alpha/beta hydrolase [Paracoccaceae bacterium]
DQAALIDQFVHNQNDITIIGHSFGGSVAMMAALRHRDKVKRLILIEPNPFYLLAQDSQSAGYKEADNLRNVIKQNGDIGSWEIAAEYFADYWNGEGSWRAMDELRQTKFVSALKPNYHEWDCVMNETTPIDMWKAKLPRNTSLLFSENTVTSILELQALFQSNIPKWQYHKYAEGGHMAPLTHPHIINPLIEEILSRTP